MRILVIGGTRFVGWHFVQAALAQGHELTLFCRGVSGQLPQGVTHLAGDRDASLDVLQQGRWDAVVDTCAYRPLQMRRMAERLSTLVERYLMISTVSVYATQLTPNHEDAPLATTDEPDAQTVGPGNYGALKALCEQALGESWAAQRVVILRPGLIVGPRDTTQRFPYWPARIARCQPDEPVLLPGGAAEPVQFIDARDLAAFMLRALEQGLYGRYNVISPPEQWNMGDVIDSCCRVAGTQPRRVWASADEVERLGLRPWQDLPLWVPAQGDHASFAATPVRAALAAGLQIRPLDQTVADTLRWWQGLPAEQQVFEQAGLSPQREAQALQALQELRA